MPVHCLTVGHESKTREALWPLMVRVVVTLTNRRRLGERESKLTTRLPTWDGSATHCATVGQAMFATRGSQASLVLITIWARGVTGRDHV